MDYFLNIMGGEWVIIIFVAIVILLGTNRLPDVAKKLGKAVGEYNKTKNDVQNQFKDHTNTNLNVNGPVQNERQKLEAIAKSIGVNFKNKSDEELRKQISSRIGSSTQESNSEKKIEK